jgi:outer membrane autotransporter protein
MNSVNLDGGSLSSAQDWAVSSKGGDLTLDLSNGATASGASGLVNAQTDPASDTPASVSVNATGDVTLNGDIQADSASTAGMSLAGNSRWTGAAGNAAAIAVDPTSTWNVTGNSTVATLKNAGVVAVVPPAGDPTSVASYKTITTGNYVGNNGTLALNTYLAGDGSPSDQLVIDGGTATGATTLSIANAVGPGVLTSGNGIQVVKTINGGSTAAGAFSVGWVVAGPYSYTLYKGGLNGSDPDGWYLRSTLDCSQPASAAACSLPSPPTPTPMPNLRPSTSLYSVLPALVRLYGLAIVSTLHERMGEERLIGGSSADNPQQPMLWGRLVSAIGWNDGAPAGIHQGDTKYNDNILAFQGGFDVLRWIGRDGSRDHAGIDFTIGRIGADVSHWDGSVAGHDRVNGKSLGLYWTHFDPSGWYLDSLAQISWTSLRAGPVDVTTPLHSDGTDVTIALEGGYPFDLGNGTFVEPQGQIIYQAIALEGADDPVTRIGFRNADSLVGRIGARVLHTWTLDDAASPHLLTTWLRPSLEYEFEGRPVTSFSSADGPIPTCGVGGAGIVGSHVPATLSVRRRMVQSLVRWASRSARTSSIERMPSA